MIKAIVDYEGWPEDGLTVQIIEEVFIGYMWVIPEGTNKLVIVPTDSLVELRDN